MNCELALKLLKEAWTYYEEALNLLDKPGWLPNAAEKAWGATEKAIRALVIAITEKSPELPSEIREELMRLEERDAELRKRNFSKRFLGRLTLLHGSCFYGGICEPREEVIRRIVETKDILREVEEVLKNKGICFVNYRTDL